MPLPAGAAGVCGVAAVAATVAFVAGAQPVVHGCLGSGAVGSATQSATVLILIEDLESDAPNNALFDATRQVAQRLSPDDVVGMDLGNESGKLDMPMQAVGDRQTLEGALATAEKQGIGDPGSYDSALSAAASALSSQSGVKEVIIIGDGDASGPSAATMARLNALGATVNSVFENPGGESPDVMQTIASQGHGSFVNAGDAANAPSALVHAVC